MYMYMIIKIVEKVAFLDNLYDLIVNVCLQPSKTEREGRSKNDELFFHSNNFFAHFFRFVEARVEWINKIESRV